MVNIKVDDLRKKHAQFIYESFNVEHAGSQLTLTFTYKISPHLVFNHKLTLPCPKEIDLIPFESLFFNLGMVIGISYWKAACPPVFHVDAGLLTEDQTAWWKDLLIQGLGEFFYLNKIDFTSVNFLNITSNHKKAIYLKKDFSTQNQDLVMVGGGKESVVMLETLSKITAKKTAFHLGPLNSASEVIKKAHYENQMTAKSQIDPLLLELNKKGYLNGHTPFSALVGFIGITAAALGGFKNVIVANERSADEETITWKNNLINHQYSKTYQFEKLFREYIFTNISEDLSYFSFLRPLYEIQIAKIFSRFPHQYYSFRSCNAGMKKSAWCKNCAKCAFTYLVLFPFVPFQEMLKIFGEDLFQSENLYEYFSKLVGFSESKPFECVGTKKESAYALLLSERIYEKENRAKPVKFVKLLSKTKGYYKNLLNENLLKEWNDKNFLSDTYAVVLKKELG